ncbi:MAG TPA: hypothetical protein VGK84_07990 [Candidatus Tumulicola sp.]|jgi:hypothetical protein
MQSNYTPAPWVQLIPFIVVLAIVAIRSIRPQRISMTRMWVQPLILVFVAVFVIYSAEQLSPTPAWEVAVALAIGAILGVPFGILRGVHTDVRPTERPGVMYLGSSWITIVIYLVAFGLRSAVRMLMPHRGSLSGAVGDGALAFAIAFIVTSYVMIARKYNAEVAGKLASPPAPPEPQGEGVAGG